jgi:hypothetical protein
MKVTVLFIKGNQQVWICFLLLPEGKVAFKAEQANRR